MITYENRMNKIYEKVPLSPKYEHHITLSVIVKDHDEEGLMSWWEAMKLFGRSGSDPNWRLPTKEELSLMYDFKEAIGGFKSPFYWSISPANADGAWGQGFQDGLGVQCLCGVDVLNAVRCVRRELIGRGSHDTP